MNPRNGADNPQMEETDAELSDALLWALHAGQQQPVILVRRCLVHHVALDHLRCPTGLHPTPAEVEAAHGDSRILSPDMRLSQWEVVNEATGFVHARVKGDYRIEWAEEPTPEDEIKLGGRDESGLSRRVAERTDAQRRAIERADTYEARASAERLGPGSGKRGRGAWLKQRLTSASHRSRGQAA